MNKIYIGIDIGHVGAIAIMNLDGSFVTHKMPMISKVLDPRSIYDILYKYKDKNCLIAYEKLGVIYGSSKTTAFSMGYQSGVVEGICISLGIPYMEIPPKEWQKEMFIGVKEIRKPPSKKSKSGKGARDTKAMALVAIKKKFPSLKLTFGERAKKPHDGLVDAVLISEFCRIRNY